MSLINWFSFLGPSSSQAELPDIFPMPIPQRDFVAIDVQNVYTRILTDVLERTQGIPEGVQALLWDNCLASESSEGLVTMLAKAMAEKRELFLVYDRALELIRKATTAEETQIKADYAKQGDSKVGVYVSFKNYTRTDMAKLYSALEYCDVSALYKSMNLSKAVQLKLSDLRSTVSLSDSADAKAQAVSIAQGLAQGKDVLLDAKDTIVTAAPDLTATKAAMEFIDRKRSFYLGLPASYITGEASKGLSDTGEGDAKAVERGLKNYYFAVVKPAVEKIFGAKTSFKSDDFRGLSSSLEALKIFELTGDELISQENKRSIVNKLFGLPEDAKGDKAKPEPKPVAAKPPVGGVA